MHVGISSGISFLGVPAYTFGDGIGYTFCLLNFPIAMGIAANTGMLRWIKSLVLVSSRCRDVSMFHRPTVVLLL